MIDHAGCGPDHSLAPPSDLLTPPYGRHAGRDSLRHNEAQPDGANGRSGEHEADAECGRALGVAERRFTVTMEHSPIGFAVLTPTCRIIEANRRLSRMLARPAFELLGSRLARLHPPRRPGRRRRADVGALSRGRRDSYTLERRYVRPRGETIWARTNVTAVRDRDGAVLQLIAQLQDVTEMRLAEEALTHQALHDPLTGLPNRTLMLDRIQQALDRTRRNRRRVAVLYCALDRFNVVNDGVGHEHGDAVLIEVARRLERALRSTDTAARLRRRRVRDRLRGRRRTSARPSWSPTGSWPPSASRSTSGGRAIVQSISVGIAVSSARAADAVSLLRDAGTALHRAQENGQDRWDVVDDDLRRRAIDRLDIEHALRAALRAPPPAGATSSRSST